LAPALVAAIPKRRAVGAERLGLRYIWFVWAAQLAALLLLAAAARGGARARPFKAAVWLVLTYCVYLSTRVCADLSRVWRGAAVPGAGHRTDTNRVAGALRVLSAWRVLFGGLLAWAACAWGTVSAGSAAAWEARHAGDEGGSAGGDEDEDKEGDECSKRLFSGAAASTLPH
jgi:hypothetical protein